MFFLSTQLYVLLQKWLCFPLLVIQTQECSYPQVCAWAIAKHRNQNKYLCCMHGITNQSYFFLGWEYNVCKGCMGVSVHLLRFSIKPITLFLFCIPYCSCWDNDDIIIFTMITTIQARCVHWLVNIHKHIFCRIYTKYGKLGCSSSFLFGKHNHIHNENDCCN